MSTAEGLPIMGETVAKTCLMALERANKQLIKILTSGFIPFTTTQQSTDLAAEVSFRFPAARSSSPVVMFPKPINEKMGS
jgi:hypothetical protein